MRLLHIEDDAPAARLLREALKGVPTSARWEGAHAETLEKGLALMRRGGFDAVLLDLGLPDSQGLSTLREVRKANPDLPVVVLTGLADQDLALQALRDGAQDCLVKGTFTGAALARILNNSVARAHVRIRLGSARRPHANPGSTWSKVRLVHVHPSEHEAAVDQHIAVIIEAGQMVVLGCLDAGADQVRERLHRAGVRTSGVLFIDATRKGPLALTGEADLEDVALAIASACDELGVRSRVVLDSLNPIVQRGGVREALRFMRLLSNHTRSLGIDVDFIVTDDQDGRAISSTSGGTVDTVMTARALFRRVAPA